jgi:hypothetical protein
MQTLGVKRKPQSTLRTGRETASQACKQSTANKRPINAATEQTKKPPDPKSKRDEAQRGAREYLTKTTAQSNESRFREGTRLDGQQNRGREIPS